MKLHVAYNIQSASNFDTKLICTINITQNPTEYYEPTPITERAIQNIKTTPKYISVNILYLNKNTPISLRR